MPRYIVLLNWTEQGIKNAKDTVKRATAARQLFEKAGAHLNECLWTLGQYDLVLNCAAPSDEVIAALGIQLGLLGNVRATTLRAFDETEMGKILKKV